MTSNLQFAGMEASTCVFITKEFVAETGARSGLLRATSRLVVISYTKIIQKGQKYEDIQARVVTSNELKKNFQVLDLTEVRQQQLSSRREEEKRIASGSLETQGSDIIIILLSGGRSCQKQHQHCHCPKWFPASEKLQTTWSASFPYCCSSEGPPYKIEAMFTTCSPFEPHQMLFDCKK